LSKLVDLSGRRHLLDLGGGPGTYAIHFCLANPGLMATIYDRPTTKDFAARTAARFGVSDRIDFQAGDFNVDEIKGKYDVAWLSHILHSNGPEECEDLIARTVSVMESGGLIMIHEFFLNQTMDGPEFPALFSLNMLINNPRSRSYSEQEIREMLIRQGVEDIRALSSYRSPNDAYVLCGTVP
jgi:predicted O-methyltransferase YrrM